MIDLLTDSSDEDDCMSDNIQVILDHNSSSPDVYRPASNSRFKTMNDVREQHDERENRQAFYAGGSEHSGQQVVGPAGDMALDGRGLVQQIARAARSSGFEDRCRGAAKPRVSRVLFQGQGHRLGETTDFTSLNEEETFERREDPEQRTVILTMYRDGFTINNGQFRDFSSPTNREFVEAVKHGIVPDELISMTREQLHVSVQDMTDTEYNPRVARTRHVAFAGQGHILGWIAPTGASGSSSVSGAAAQPESSVPQTDDQAQPETELLLDESQPVLFVQVRMPSGSVIKIKVNPSHSIQDLVNYIRVNNSNLADIPFELATNFPVRPLRDLTQSVETVANNTLILRKL